MSDRKVLYAKKDLYAAVEEEGGLITRLIATKGDPVPVTYIDLVDADDVTDELPTTGEEGILTPDPRNTAKRRATGQTVNEAEQKNAGEKAQRSAPDKARKGSGNKARKGAETK